jgi:recombination protein RecR
VSSRPRSIAEPVTRLIEELGRLPGVGPKSASRLAYHLLKAPKQQAVALAEAVLEVKEKVRFCSECYNLTENDPCDLCMDPGRDRTILCVIEEPLDLVALERTGEYNGLYHVLHGAINPIDGIGPDQLRIRELFSRLQRPDVKEVILAMNPITNGEATAMYLFRAISPLGIRVTRPASGLPVGGDLEYADQVTLGRALTGRREL